MEPSTAREVADRVGVSISTVSRTLSAPDLVAPATRHRVQEVARELGYRPHRAASNLATGRTMTLGLVVPDLENPYFSSVVKGVQSRARTGGYTVAIADSDEDPEREVELARDLARQVDGLVLSSPRAPDAAVTELAAITRVVLMNRAVDDLPTVSVDNHAAVMTALAHLHALGHRRVAWVGGPVTSWSDARRREALSRTGDRFDDLEVVDLGHFRPQYDGGAAAADLVLASGASAVLAFNDLVAIGLVQRAGARGASVPADLSVVGIDDLPIASLYSPALTTVRIPRARLGTVAVQALLASLDGPGPTAPSPETTMGVELVVRGSTAVPPSPR